MEQNQGSGITVTAVTGKCPLCREEGEVVLTFDQAQRYQTSRDTGQFLQDALPDLSPGLREQLISGSHPACFDRAFREPDEDQEQVYAYISAGSMEYDIDEAAVPIEEMIEALTRAHEDGATHVVGSSGNYRGAQYVRLGLPTTEEDY